MTNLIKLNGVLTVALVAASASLFLPKMLRADDGIEAQDAEAMSTSAAQFATQDWGTSDDFAPVPDPVHSPGPLPGPVHPPIHQPPVHQPPTPHHPPMPGPHHPPMPGPHHPPLHHPPFVNHGGAYPWAHWAHPGFVRPVLNWVWANLTSVTCTAQDSMGDQYPVTESGYIGQAYESRMDQVEDAALDECYSESGGDASCSLVGCSPTY